MEGNSKLAVAGQAARVVGPTMAGALVQPVTAPLAMLADAASFIVSAVLLGTIRARSLPRPTHPATARLWQAIGEGLAISCVTPCCAR